jgi:copper chaperone
MQTFRVDDMTCGHCVSTITKAVRAVDAGAKVEVDLAQHLVRIEPTEADAAELADAITEAGYTPVAVPSPTTAAQPAKPAGCCGCCR